MSSIITSIIGFTFFIFSYRLKLIYLLFLFLIPFLPSYIGFGVGNEGFSLSAKRISLIILMCSFLMFIFKRSSHALFRIKMTYRYNKLIIVFMLLFFCIKIFSLTINKAEISLYIMLFNDFLFSIFIYLFTVITANSDEVIQKIIKISFYSYSTVLIISIIESVVKFPLLSFFSSGQMTLLEDVSEGHFRDSNYRLLAGFTNPVCLGEYIAVMFPIVLFYLKHSIKSITFITIYILLILYVIYNNGSRSPILFIGISAYIYIFLRLKNSTGAQRVTFSIINSILIILTIFYIASNILEIKNTFSGSFLDYTAKERSVIARALQYPIIFAKLQDALLFGFGRDRNYVESFDEIYALDNHYLSVLLEVGIIGITVYFIFYFTVINSAIRLYLRRNSIYILPFSVSIILLMCYQFTVAIPDINIYFYIILGILNSININNHIKQNNESIIST